MYDAIQAETVRYAAGDGDLIEGYLATPLGPGPYGAVVVLHHAPGYDEPTKEITRRFASEGYLAICPNLFSRQAPGLPPREASAQAKSMGGTPDAQLITDVAGSVELLKSRTSSNGKVGVIGYCTGGRQAVLAACSLPFDAAVDCYGAFVTRTAPAEQGWPRPDISALIPSLSCPLLGLFGAQDPAPSPDEVAELELLLKENGKDYELHSYPDAGHAFFSTDSQKYRTTPALEGWQEIQRFFGQHLNT
jgi:carboxymethylenebutenolidase